MKAMIVAVVATICFGVLRVVTARATAGATVSLKPSTTNDGISRNPESPSPKRKVPSVPSISSIRAMYSPAVGIRSSLFFSRPSQINASTLFGTRASGAVLRKGGTSAEVCMLKSCTTSSASKGGTPAIISYNITDSA